ncbi:LCP family glycopolymer transferase CpsA [Streptococcus caprae]|uniref:LCP family protein n=1 Tax=Streptococcus caprae TaxID=1640501 RepID=A0ABV8CUM3_9STRE
MNQRSSKYRKSSKKQNSGFSLLNLTLLTIFTIVSALLVFFLFAYNIAGFWHLNLIFAIALAVNFLLTLICIVTKKAKKTTTVLLVIFTLVSALGLVGVRSAVDLANRVNGTAMFSEVKMSVMVPVSSSVQDISEVSSVLAPTTLDQESIDQLISQLSTTKGLTLSLESTDSYLTAYESLMAGQGQAMVLSSSYESLLEDVHSDYASNLREIYSYTITTTKQSTTEDAKQEDGDVLNIYISGIDTYGSISTTSRSDVNIILTVNRKTKKILMTTTPRDSYVPIAGGGNNQYDKLTHAGIYGVDSSIQTLENLYGIDINYYVKVNFTSFINLIDQLGGVEVYNDQAFTAHTNKDYTFEVGNVTLDSAGALAFVRERYSLANGDADRANNQMKVIKAIIDKMTSFNSISSFTTIINHLGSSVQTDMSLETMMNLANDQIESGGNYVITSQAITGTGSTGQLTSYAMPSASLYMLSIDENSLNTAKAAIQAVEDGN